MVARRRFSQWRLSPRRQPPNLRRQPRSREPRSRHLRQDSCINLAKWTSWMWASGVNPTRRHRRVISTTTTTTITTSHISRRRWVWACWAWLITISRRYIITSSISSLLTRSGCTGVSLVTEFLLSDLTKVVIPIITLFTVSDSVNKLITQ